MGELVIAKVNENLLRDFAQLAGGLYSRMTSNDDDIERLLSLNDLEENSNYIEAERREFDAWHEEGPLLVLLLVPFAALAFRRGLILFIPLFMISPFNEVEASIWDDLWKTPNQQAMAALEQGDSARASQLFEDENWKGIANYRNKEFTRAANNFRMNETSWGKYNLGNALAKSGDFKGAVSAYEESLEINPDNEDARYNKKIIEQLIKNQSEPEKNNSGNEKKIRSNLSRRTAIILPKERKKATINLMTKRILQRVRVTKAKMTER